MHSQLNISHNIAFIYEKVSCLVGPLFCHLTLFLRSMRKAMNKDILKTITNTFSRKDSNCDLTG